MNISGKTKAFAVIGYPVSHSLSPKLHNYIASEMGHDIVYTALSVRPENIKEAIDGIRALGIAGVNATAPHKYSAFSMVDVLSDDAKMYGSVNTIVNRSGVLEGYSTDGPGLLMSMKRAGIFIKNKNILVLGAGGVAAPVCIMLASEGAAGITVRNRTASHVDHLYDVVKKACDYEIIKEEKNIKYDIVINCTSLGMEHNKNECAVSDFSMFDADTAAVDLIYRPAETLFLKKARERGAKTLNGLGMLVYQGIIAYEKFMDCTLPDDMGMRVTAMLEGREYTH